MIRHLTTRVLAGIAIGAATSVPVASSPARAVVDLDPLKVVSIGDSYMAGNGARDDERNYPGPSDCCRRPWNWAGRYTESLFDSSFGVTYVRSAAAR